jgi:hypothetical protein
MVKRQAKETLTQVKTRLTREQAKRTRESDSFSFLLRQRRRGQKTLRRRGQKTLRRRGQKTLRRRGQKNRRKKRKARTEKESGGTQIRVVCASPLLWVVCVVKCLPQDVVRGSTKTPVLPGNFGPKISHVLGFQYKK